MIDHNEKHPGASNKWQLLRRWQQYWDQPSETARHYYHILLAIVMFFAGQLLTCAWDQPFWAYGLDFPGQIVAMVFVWLAMWAAQAVFFKQGEGLDRFYHQHLRAPVSFFLFFFFVLFCHWGRCKSYANTGNNLDRDSQQAYVYWVYGPFFESHHKAVCGYGTSWTSHCCFWYVLFLSHCALNTSLCSFSSSIVTFSCISLNFKGSALTDKICVTKVVTGILNVVLVYAVAYHVQLWTTKVVARWARFREEGSQARSGMMIRRNTSTAEIDVEEAPSTPTTTINNEDTCCCCCGGQQRTSSTDILGGVSSDLGDRNRDNYRDIDTASTCPSCLERSRNLKHISDVSTLCTLSGYTSDANGPNTTTATSCLEPGSDGAGRPADALWALESRQPSAGSKARRIAARWLRRNVLLTFSFLLFLVVGIPVACFRGDDLFLDIGFVCTVWLIFTTAQSRVKAQQQQQRGTAGGQQTSYRRSLITLAALLNPVLWTSLFLLCYGLLMARIRDTSTATIVARFKTGNTVSDLIAHRIDLSNLPTSSVTSTTATTIIPFGAGDLATSILNAGIVSWGLKLFEYRTHLLSRAGFSVVFTTAMMAGVNVLCWPILVFWGMRVRPGASALSFAARSVTIALGGPAMEALGGDAGINAVGVVVNGIVFQLGAGLLGVTTVRGGEVRGEGVMGWVKRKINPWLVGRSRRIGDVRDEEEGGSKQVEVVVKSEDVVVVNDRGLGISSGGEDEDAVQDAARAFSSPSSPSPSLPRATEAGLHNASSIFINNINPPNSSPQTTTSSTLTTNTLPPPSPQLNLLPHNHNHPSPPTSSSCSCPCHNNKTTTPTTNPTKTVANGITIGINAAAMGTSHLYEQKSPAAAYSALSMTTFGVFTVLFTIRGPAVGWLVGVVGGW